MGEACRGVRAGVRQVVGLVLLLLGLGMGAALVQRPAQAAPGPVIVEDLYGRRVNDRFVQLVDWDGYLANPAMRFTVRPPEGAALPGSVLIFAPEARMYFNGPSAWGDGGPSKIISLPTQGAAEFYLSIFPDRDTQNEVHALTLRFTDANGAQSETQIPVHVLDQDRATPGPFNILTDFSKDQTGFYGDAAKRALLQQVAADWAYFFDIDPDTVGAGTELTWIWNPDGFNSGSFTTNASAYKGFQLYTYGIHHAQLRSGGEGSYQGGFQSVGGNPLPLRRSGGVEIETHGNWNELGWFLTTGDDDWWVSGNFGNEPNDLYSIAHHEMGHAIGFNGAYPEVVEAQNRGFIDDPDVLAYHGSNPAFDGSDHLANVVDRLSLRGAFGNEYNGFMPARRWLITRLDLLCMKAMGYPLRATSAFVPLSLPEQEVPDATVGTQYSHQFAGEGGLPAYDWRIASGRLPNGLTLDPFTGVLSGTPTEPGTFSFTVLLREYDQESTGVTRSFSLTSRVQLAALTLASSVVPGPVSTTGRVTLSGTLDTDTVMALGTTNPAAAVPTSVTIPAGETGVDFTISTSPVTEPVIGSVSATLSGITKNVGLTVRPVSVESITVAPNSVVGGGGRTVTGTVMLEAPVPEEVESIVVTLKTGSTKPAWPAVASLLFTPGEQSGSFAIETASVEAATSVAIRATANRLYKTANLTVKPVTVQAVVLDPDRVIGSTQGAGAVRLDYSRPVDTVVQLASTNTAVAVPDSTVVIPANTLAASFNVATHAVAVTTKAAIRATLSGVSRSAALYVIPISVQSVSVSPNPAPGGATATGTVTLTAPATPGGMTVTLRSQYPSIASVPASVTVPAGANSVDFPVTTQRFKTVKTTTISAVAGGVRRSVLLTVQP